MTSLRLWPKVTVLAEIWVARVRTGVTTLDMQLVASWVGSAQFEPGAVSTAVLSTSPLASRSAAGIGAATVTLMVSVTLAPAATGPSAQVSTWGVPAAVQAEALSLTKV